MDVAAGAVFTAGLLTFLAPCVLPLVPIYLGILAGEARDDEGAVPSRLRPFVATVFFALGFTLVFSLIGLSATVVGGFLLHHQLLFQQLGGVVILLLGLTFLGWLKLPFSGGSQSGLGRLKTRFHYLNAFLMGVFFAFAWSPCVGSVLGAVLTFTSLSTTSVFEGMGLLALYSLGFALPLLAASAFAGPALVWLKKSRRFIPIFERVTGALLVVTGLLFVTDKLGLIDYALSRPSEPVAHVSSAATGTLLAAAAGGVSGASCGAAHEAPAIGTSCGTPGHDAGGAMSDAANPAVPSPFNEPISGGPPLVDERPLPTVTEFFSPGCPVCRQMIPLVTAVRSQCAGKSVRFRFVDTSTRSGRAQARASGVSGIPVFTFADAAGRESARLVGYQSMGALEQAVAVLIGEACRGYRPFPAPGP